MKKVIQIIAVMLITMNAKSQTNIDSTFLNAVIQLSPIIFEGQIIDQCTFDDPLTGIIYTSNIVQISKLVKGQLSCGTVTIITKGGDYNDNSLTVSHETHLTTGFSGLFICKKSLVNNSTNCQITDNSIPLEFVTREFSYISYYNDFVNEIAMGLNSQFHDIQDLYNFIQTTGYTIQNCSNSNFDVSSWSNNNYTKPINLGEQNNEDELLKKTRAGTTLQFTYGIQDIKTVGNTKSYEVRINVKADDSLTYLDECAFRIKFNTDAFGIQIANNITTTLGANFDPSTYATIQKINKSDSVFSIWIHQATGPLNRTKIKTTSQHLLTLTIPYDSCQYYPNLQMDTFANILAYSFYTPTQSGASSTSQPYDSVISNAFKSGVICTPYISSSTSFITGSDTVAAGRGEKIQLKGSDFGNKKGKLYLPNADKAGASYTKLDNYDIQSWSDTEIVYRLPAIIDSGVVGTATAYEQSTPGTGRQIIVNDWTAVSDSTNYYDTLFIKFAAMEKSRNLGTNSYYKNNQYLFTLQSDSAYTFKLNNTITNPKMKDCIRKAIQEWRCLVGVNFKLDETVVSTGIADDNYSVIKIQTIDTTGKTLAQTYSYSKYNCTATGTSSAIPAFPKTNIDIQLNPLDTAFFFYDETGTQDLPALKYDFYAIIFHELGHALSQFHVNQVYDPMYPYNNKYSTNTLAIDRPRIKPIYYNQEGGDYIMDGSTHLASFNLTCSGVTLYPQAMQDTTCRVFPLGINSTIIKPTEFEIYPNPFNDKFILDIPLINSKMYYAITDITGKIILTAKVTQQKTEIQTQNFSSGLYFVTISNEKTKTTKKIVCAK